jgi:hypothetical protein
VHAGGLYHQARLLFEMAVCREGHPVVFGMDSLVHDVASF